jgi:hypothetical protein
MTGENDACASLALVWLLLADAEKLQDGPSVGWIDDSTRKRNPEGYDINNIIFKSDSSVHMKQ